MRRIATAFSVLLMSVFAAPFAIADDMTPQLRTAIGHLEAQLRLTAADHTALKTAAEKRVVKSLRVCGDPGNMPLSDINRDGYQNKVIELIAKEIGATVKYFWRPYLMRGITRQTFDTHDCDILLDMPVNFEQIITTEPVYRTTYVMAWRKGSGIDIDSLDDPDLKKLRIGVFQTSGLRTALTRRGVIENVSLHVISHNSDLKLENQPWQQVQKVLDGKLDIAGVWGPFAGWLAKRGEPLVIQPTNLWEDRIPQEFELAIGLRKIDWVLKYKLDLALKARAADVEKILRDFGVPLVQCSKCIVAGDLPSHGIYTKPLFDGSVASAPGAKAAHQIVDKSRVEDWISAGADLDQELRNAVLASDAERVRWLVGKSANVNAPDKQGNSALHTAARHRDGEMVKLLIELGADPNKPDGDGYAPLHLAVLRNSPETVAALSAGGANLDLGDANGINALAIAIVESQYKAAIELIKLGAGVELVVGDLKLTPLMLAAGKEGRHMMLGAGVRRVEKYDSRDPETIDIMRALIARGVDVNRKNRDGTTALMLAASHNNTPIVGLLVQSGADPNIRDNNGKTASDLAVTNGNNAVVGLLKLLAQSQGN